MLSNSATIAAAAFCLTAWAVVGVIRAVRDACDLYATLRDARDARKNAASRQF